ncbi:MAG TPA: hypothetical protein VFQ92_14540 [Blastocatellia bacterium]|nr:hypothetical protein [Blastocatellia bacterium]
MTGSFPGRFNNKPPKERPVPQSLKKRAADLERRVGERAEFVKKLLKEYRETVRTTASRLGDRDSLNKKRLDVERANAEYMRLQKELERLRSELQAGK